MNRDPAGNRHRHHRRPIAADRPTVHIGPSKDDEHEIKYFRRHHDDDPDQTAPGQAFVEAAGARKAWLVVVTGLGKPWRTAFSDADYRAVRNLGDEYINETRDR